MSVADRAWAFILRKYKPKFPIVPPRIVYDSTALMREAHGRPNALAAYRAGKVYLPTHGYSDETLGPLLVHEYTHHVQTLLFLDKSEEEAYANQKQFETEEQSI